MRRDVQRIRIIQHVMGENSLDALVCAIPANVLMLSGYWPVVGTAVAVVTSQGHVVVIAPQDEQELASQSWADDVRIFEPGSLQDLRDAVQGIRPVLADVISSLKLGGRRVGCECGSSVVASPYVAVHQYGAALREMVQACVRADSVLARLRSVKTPDEIERIELSCKVAAEAFARGVEQLRAGATESEIAAKFRHPLLCPQIDLDQHRVRAETFCMSGPNSYKAFAAYQRSGSRVLGRGDLALVHCNSCVDGFWTDITRTYVVGGEVDDRQRRMYQAIFEAREAALSAIRPGVRAADVDRAARDVMARHRFGDEFKHPTGHGVGFAAINHNASPRIHPKSSDVLEEGMTFNVEPGIYLEGYGGMRHCDMVAVTADGFRVLTPFQCDIAAMLGEHASREHASGK